MVLRVLMASLLVACLSVAWPLTSQAGKSGGGSGKSAGSTQNTSTQQQAGSHSGTGKTKDSFGVEHQQTIGSKSSGAGSGNLGK
jgi:hypothetical protein